MSLRLAGEQDGAHFVDNGGLATPSASTPLPCLPAGEVTALDAAGFEDLGANLRAGQHLGTWVNLTPGAGLDGLSDDVLHRVVAAAGDRVDLDGDPSVVGVPPDNISGEVGGSPLVCDGCP